MRTTLEFAALGASLLLIGSEVRHYLYHIRTKLHCVPGTDVGMYTKGNKNNAINSEAKKLGFTFVATGYSSNTGGNT